MFLQKFINLLPVKSMFVKIIIGWVIIALISSLWKVFVLKLMNMPVNPSVPASFAATGILIFIKKFNKEEEE